MAQGRKKPKQVKKKGRKQAAEVVEASDKYEEEPVIDPQVTAYVGGLVGALGGKSADEDDKYVPGDDALGCLKDLKRWLRLYDERFNRLDVARYLAFSKTVSSDLLEIIALWRDDGIEDPHKGRLALACLELLVPLTWPLEKTDDQYTRNHHRHLPALRKAQVQYKKDILNYELSGILRQVIRVGLPSMAAPLRERGGRGEGILRLVLYFLRNVASISNPPGEDTETDDLEMSRSAVIHAFQYQDVFQLLLTMSSMMGEEFDSQDVILIEILFYLLRGVDVEKVFLNEDEMIARKGDELRGMLGKESVMRRGPMGTKPTRHNRFGTTLWLGRSDEKRSIVHGQVGLLHADRALEKMDASKKFNKPRKKETKDKSVGQDEFDTPVQLTDAAYKHLRGFLELFLDSCFNPLFNHFRRAIEREAERIQLRNERQFYFLVSWMLRAARMRANVEKKAAERLGRRRQDEMDGFTLVASVLTQEMFINLTRFLRRSLDDKAWRDANAAMRCFTQILLTVQDMGNSPLDEDQEIAENIQNRLFYEEATHELVVQVARGYTNQGFGYLDASTELLHVFLRMLENYSKQNLDMQIRSKRVTRKKKPKTVTTDPATSTDPGQDTVIDGVGVAYQDDEAADLTTAQAMQTSRERKFDFARFANKFASQHCVDAFVRYTSFYSDLSTAQLKRAHRFLHRIAFKMELSVLLMKVDTIQLLVQMMKGTKALDPKHEMYREWDELIRQVIRKLVKKIQQRPELGVELLFGKIPATMQWLEHGKETIVHAVRKPVKAAAMWEVKPGAGFEGVEEQIRVVVAALIDRGNQEDLGWLKAALSNAAEERRAWEGANAVELHDENPDTTTVIDGGADPEGNDNLPSNESAGPQEPVDVLDQTTRILPPSVLLIPGTPQRCTIIHRNPRVRLLLHLVGCQPPIDDEDAQAPWTIPSTIRSSTLFTHIDTIKDAEFSPVVLEDGKSAEDCLRAKPKPRPPKAMSDGGSGSDTDDLLFPDNLRRPRGDALDELTKARKSRKRKRRTADDGEEEDGDDSEAERQREAKRQKRKESERNRKKQIKSELYIRDESDSENDAAFFERENRLRAFSRKEIAVAVADGVQETSGGGPRRTEGRSGWGLSDTDEDEDEETVDAEHVPDKEADSVRGERPGRRPRDPGDTDLTSTDDEEPAPRSPAAASTVSSDALRDEQGTEMMEVDTPVTSESPGDLDGLTMEEKMDAALGLSTSPRHDGAKSPLLRQQTVADGEPGERRRVSRRIVDSDEE